MYLILWWGVGIINEGVPPEGRTHNITLQKIAKMEMSFRKSLEGTMLAFMGGCGAYLFALLGTRGTKVDMVQVVGYIGLAAGVLVSSAFPSTLFLSRHFLCLTHFIVSIFQCLISALYTATKARMKQRRGASLNVGQPSPAPSPTEEIEACSWWYQAISYLGILILITFYVLYAITLSDRWFLYACFVLPLVGSSMVLSVFMRPLDNGAGIRFLHLQFLTFALGAEIPAAISNYRKGNKALMWFALGRIPFEFVIYGLSLKIRSKATQLAKPKLSAFLCSMLLSGARTIASIVFFIFEGFSCYAKEDLSILSGWCQNSSMATMYLSIYLTILLAITQAQKLMTSEERGSEPNYDNLAIMRLSPWQKLQGALGAAMVVSSMYLFSVLGVRGDYNTTTRTVGDYGLVCGTFTLLIELIAVLQTFSWCGRYREGMGRPSSHWLSIKEGGMGIAGFL